jgi:hypothetical protein
MMIRSDAMRLLPVSLLVGMTGCAQIFGIDKTSAPPSGAAATLALERRAVGATVIDAPLDLSGLTASWLVPDAGDPGARSPVMGAESEAGTWSADVEGAPAVLFTLPDLPAPASHLWALQSRAMAGDFVAFEHADPQPAPMAAQLALNVTLPGPYDPAAGESFAVEVIGAWMRYGLQAADLPAMGAAALAPTMPCSCCATPATTSPACSTRPRSIRPTRRTR